MLNYSYDRLTKYEVGVIANSRGIIVIHVRGRSPLLIAARLRQHCPVNVIMTAGKTSSEIRALVADQYGKSGALVIDEYDHFVEPLFLQDAAEQINGSLVCINRRGY